MGVRLRQVGLGVALVAGAVGLTACDQVGESGVKAEWARVKTLKGFAVLEQTRDKAEVLAQGQQVSIAAARGFCIAEDAIEVTRRGIVAVISDCVDSKVKITQETTGATIELPPSFPGITTVSVTGKEGAAATSALSDLDAFQAFFQTKRGQRMLGRSRDGETLTVGEMRPIGETLYVHVHDTGGDSLGIFAPDFWRAFLRINDRLVLVTVNGFAARPLEEEDMLGFLAAQVVQLREANGSTPPSEEVQLAALVEGRFDARSGPVSYAELELDDGTAPKKAPKPVTRPGSNKRVAVGGPAEAGHVARPASRWAPVRAPIAPARPG